MADFTLTTEEYEALVFFARKGATEVQTSRNLDNFLKSIEKKNGITRHGLWIQWQEAGKQVPTTAKFPEAWPPELRYYLELLSRPIAKADVMTAVGKKARKPLNIMVTPDPAGVIGWTLIDAYFANG